MALTPVPTAYTAEMVDRDNSVSSRIGSMKIEKTYDWPGPDAKFAQAAIATTNHP
jgi:hypothetical protein